MSAEIIDLRDYRERRQITRRRSKLLEEAFAAFWPDWGPRPPDGRAA